MKNRQPVTHTNRHYSVFTPLCLCRGNFNCQHTDWGYGYINRDGERLAEWEAKGNISLLYNPKDASSFFSGRWNMETNPNPVLANDYLNSFELERRKL